MTTILASLRRPEETADPAAQTLHRKVGIAVALAGVMIAVAAFIGNIVAVDDSGLDRAQTLAWTFGLATTAFAVVKVGIAITLIGILGRVWLRIASVKAALPELSTIDREAAITEGELDTPFGPATVSRRAPGLLIVHKMARLMWAPMLAMGPMLVLVGLVLSFVQAGEDGSTFIDLSAWTQGLQFLGEGMLLAGISFVLGSILAALREGGGQVQESLGVAVKTLRMPWSAKAFLALMMAGLMTAIVQFILYVYASTVDDPTTWFAVLGPLREVALGLLLSGIVLALYTIGTVLGFQFARIRDIVTTGR